jgi:hypothetical protein
MKNRILPLILLVATIRLTTGQILFSGSYSEDFDNIIYANDTGIIMNNVGVVGLQDALPGLAGWQAARVSGTATTTFALYAKDGTSGTGRLYSFGGISIQERALGSVASGTVTAGFGLELKNDSQDTFTSLTVSFDREVWRNQSAAAADSLSFAYGLASAGIGSGNYLTNTLMSAFPALDAISPAELGNATSAGRNGNADALAVSATITGLTWEPGDSLFLRWNDFDNTGTDAGIGIDQLRIIATVPEPTVTTLVAFGLVAFGLLQRRARGC